MLHRTCILLVYFSFIGGLGQGTTDAAPRLKDSPEEKLAGTWRQTYCGHDGQDKTKAEAFSKNHWVITTETISIHTTHGFSGRWTYKLDTSVTPATLDLTTQGNSGKPITYPCIIRIEAKQITVCLQNFPERGRPKNFDPQAESGIGKFIYERVQAGDELKIVLPKPKAPEIDD